MPRNNGNKVKKKKGLGLPVVEKADSFDEFKKSFQKTMEKKRYDSSNQFHAKPKNSFTNNHLLRKNQGR
jgi:hypothetical protein